MTDKKLNLDASDASPASNIVPPKPPSKATLEEMLNIAENYFKNCSYDCGKNYNDGFNVELIREKFDISNLLRSILRICFDHVRNDKSISDTKKVELSRIHKAIDALIPILEQEEEKSVAHIDILCKIIGYCMKNYKLYNNYDKLQQIQE
tara:strand:- start:2067 stop:2516 length:450 start_codon:yes stop_codon:yes gene_type:complete